MTFNTFPLESLPMEGTRMPLNGRRQVCSMTMRSLCTTQSRSIESLTSTTKGIAPHEEPRIAKPLDGKAGRLFENVHSPTRARLATGWVATSV